ncbi:hypothetical protein V7127_23200 [Bacillus sp. JJ1773]|uniref:hypothetical protein n=1 Tax=Bacillus sp. JJ1773 TaxID=3122965 RepID=UPI003000E6A8
MVKNLRHIGLINSILIAIILFLWNSVFFINGLIGAYSWAILKMILPIIGFFGVLINIILFIVGIVKKKKNKNYW